MCLTNNISVSEYLRKLYVDLQLLLYSTVPNSRINAGLEVSHK